MLIAILYKTVNLAILKEFIKKNFFGNKIICRHAPKSFLGYIWHSTSLHFTSLKIALELIVHYINDYEKNIFIAIKPLNISSFLLNFSKIAELYDYGKSHKDVKKSFQNVQLAEI